MPSTLIGTVSPCPELWVTESGSAAGGVLPLRFSSGGGYVGPGQSGCTPITAMSLLRSGCSSSPRKPAKPPKP